MNMSGREKKIVNKKQVRHFLHKTFSQEVSGSFTLYSCKTTGKKSTKKVAACAKLLFSSFDLLLFFFHRSRRFLRHLALHDYFGKFNYK